MGRHASSGDNRDTIYGSMNRPIARHLLAGDGAPTIMKVN